MSDRWTDRLAGARMQVDKTFQPRVEQSDFTRQEWGLIMTAVEFDIEAPQDPSAAQMVARTDKIEQIMPELGRIQKQIGGGPTPEGSSSGGITGRLQNLKDSLTGDSSPDTEARQADAVVLVEAYARELQDYLEEQGRWADICEAAADQRSTE